MTPQPANRQHDVGGKPTGEPIPRGQHPFHPWEMRVDALMMVLTDARRPGGPRMTVDELRRGIESLSAEDYRSFGYYEKWLSSLVTIMTEKGVIDGAALARRVAEVTKAYKREHAAEHALDHAAGHEPDDAQEGA